MLSLTDKLPEILKSTPMQILLVAPQKCALATTVRTPTPNKAATKQGKTEKAALQAGTYRGPPLRLLETSTIRTGKASSNFARAVRAYSSLEQDTFPQVFRILNNEADVGCATAIARSKTSLTDLSALLQRGFHCEQHQPVPWDLQCLHSRGNEGHF